MNIKGQHVLEGRKSNPNEKEIKNSKSPQSMEALVEREISEDTLVHYSLQKESNSK